MPTSDQLFGNNTEIKIESMDHLDDASRELLKWILKTEDKFVIKHIINKKDLLKTLVPLKTVPSYALPDFIYEMIYKESEHFENDLKKYGSMLGFHGSSLENWYSIVNNGLQNYSHTKKMKNGAIFGDGMYFCEDIVVAHDFLVPGNSWKHSNMGKNIGIVCVCEIINHPNVIVNKDNIGVSKSTKVFTDFSHF
jgi:hypothetical protein